MHLLNIYKWKLDFMNFLDSYLGLDISQILILLAIVFIGAIVTAITGFGGGIVSMPLFLQFFPLKFINPLYNIIYLFNNLILFRPTKAKLDKKLLFFLLLGNLIGAFVGAAILKQYSNQILIKLIGAFIVFWELKAIYEILAKKELDKFKLKSSKPKNWLNLIVGSVSGIMSSVFGIGGPPLVIYLKNFLKDKEVMRATLIGFFTVNGFIQVTAFAYNGLFTMQMVLLAVLSLPVLLIGSYLGSIIAKTIPQKPYQIAVSLVLILAGFLLLIR